MLNNSSGEHVDKDVNGVKQNFSIGTIINIPAAAAVLYKPGMLNILSVSSSAIIIGGVNEMGCSVSVHSVVGLDSRNNSVMQQGIAVSPLCQSTVLLNRFTESSLKSLVLMCIWPSGSLSSPPLQNTLDRAVFQQLFGSEISLFDSSVLVIGTSSGHIYYFPLADGVTCHKEKLSQPFLSQDESGQKTHSFSLVPSLLFCLEQPVSAVYLANIPFEREENSEDHIEKQKLNYSNCVLFIGKRDKLLVSYQNKSSDKSRNADFAVGQIPGPVCCSAMEAVTNVLIHSTGKEIFISKIELQKTQLSATAYSEHVVVQTVHCIKIPFVCTMVHVTLATKEPDTDEIIVLTLKGKLEKFKISNLLDSSSFSFMKMSPKIAGNKIKCFLSDIAKTSEKLSQLNLSINAEDAILKELNVATSFICSVMDKEQFEKGKHLSIKEGSDCDDHGIHFSVSSSVSYEGNLTGPLVNIQCKVTNNCNITFCKGWSFLVQVSVAEQRTFNFTGSQRIKSKAVPLNEFATGQHVVLEFLLDSLTPFYSVKINFFLYFDLNAILSKLSSSLSSESVVVPLNVKYLDVIDFLKPLSRSKSCFESQGTSQFNRQSVQQKISTAVKNVESLFSSQIFSLEPALNNATTSVRSPQTLYQFVLPLSENCVHYIYQHILTNKDVYNAKESLTFQEAVLLFLTVRNKALWLDCGQGSIKAKTPTGEQVELHVCHRSVSTDDVQENAMMTNYCKLELVLRSSAIQLLCCLHGAVLTRFQVKQIYI